jgi:hypothetical protein
MDGIASVDLLWFRRLPFNNSMHFLFSAIDGGSSCGFAVTRNPTAEWLAAVEDGIRTSRLRAARESLHLAASVAAPCCGCCSSWNIL